MSCEQRREPGSRGPARTAHGDATGASRGVSGERGPTREAQGGRAYTNRRNEADARTGARHGVARRPRAHKADAQTIARHDRNGGRGGPAPHPYPFSRVREKRIFCAPLRAAERGRGEDGDASNRESALAADAPNIARLDRIWRPPREPGGASLRGIAGATAGTQRDEWHGVCLQFPDAYKTNRGRPPRSASCHEPPEGCGGDCDVRTHEAKVTTRGTGSRAASAGPPCEACVRCRRALAANGNEARRAVHRHGQDLRAAP